jgi:tetratricopeptide (TPR) repeat protein
LVAQAERDLKNAQQISPLNTDHTANLARLYSLWASLTDDPALKNERAKISSDYFSRAVSLSPQNARLWDEWAILYLNILQDLQEASQRLEKAREIDPFYDWTYGLLGDYYARTIQNLPGDQDRQEALENAAVQYRKAIELSSPEDPQLRYSYSLALGGVEAQLERTEAAIVAYEQALQWSPYHEDNWRIYEAIARLYVQNGDLEFAVSAAEDAIEIAPEDQRERIQNLINQLSGQP